MEIVLYPTLGRKIWKNSYRKGQVLLYLFKMFQSEKITQLMATDFTILKVFIEFSREWNCTLKLSIIINAV